MTAGFFSGSSPLTLVAPRRQVVGPTPKCWACRLHLQCQNPKLEVWGEGKRGVLLVGDAPDADDDARGRPFVGRGGRLLRRVLNELNVDLDEDCWSMNALACHPPRGRAPTSVEVDHCRPTVVNAIRQLQPSVIVLLGDPKKEGSAAIGSVIGWLWKEDAGGVAKWVGFKVPVQKINTWVCSVWHPNYVAREAAGRDGRQGRDYPLIERMFKEQLEAAFALKGRPWDKVPNYRERVRVILDPNEAAGIIRKLLNKNAGPVAWDIETNMLGPDGPDAAIWSCSMCAGGESISYPWHGVAVNETLKFLKSDVPKIGFNVRFETRWIKARHGIWVRNWIHDGMLAAHVLDNRKDINGLKFQAFARLGVDSYDESIRSYLKSNGSRGKNTPNCIHEAPLPLLLEYGGMDSLLEYELAMVQMKELNINLKGNRDEN